TTTTSRSSSTRCPTSRPSPSWAGTSSRCSAAVRWPPDQGIGSEPAMERRGLNVRKVLLGIVLPALRRLPPRVASNVVAGIGRTEYALFRGLRHRVDEAVLNGSHH